MGFGQKGFVQHFVGEENGHESRHERGGIYRHMEAHGEVAGWLEYG